MKASVHLLSLGCAKNLVDSEVMLGSLLKAGYTLEAVQENADVVIVNTCGFVEGSKQESINTILEANQLRTVRPDQKLVVAGCLAQRYAKDLEKELPEIEALIGINEVPRIPEILDTLTAESPPTTSPPAATHPINLVTRKPSYLYDFATPRFQLTPGHYAYLKVGEGCNHPCAFCSIPIMRGRHRSRTIQDVVAEARSLVARGVKELLLISQDTTYFGKDLKIPNGLSLLLRELNAIEGDFWIRILYTHPAHWTDELMDVIAECPKVCRYIDIPLQHIHEEMLIRMRRETSREHIESVIQRLRTRIPGIAIRTTFIVGFPGETDSQFESLLQFIKDARFERLGVFEYSKEDGTVANKMDRHVPANVKKERRRKIMSAQQTISSRIMKAHVGQTLRVLVENDGKNAWGRTEFDAAEIDGKVHLKGSGWKTGTFQDVKITDATHYDLVGTLA